jgi:histidinol-phosphatase
MPPVADDLEIALELADLADRLTTDRYRAADLVVDTKPDLTPVTEADRAVEEALRARLAHVCAGDAVVGEEFGAAGGDGSRRWIIDPIDGTKSYVRGIPTWSTLIALEIGGEIVVGVCSAPAFGRRWWAQRGAGAWVAEGEGGGARQIHVSGVRELGDAHLSFGGFEEWDELGEFDSLLELGRRCWRTRGFGDAWSYMLVAEGAVEIALDPQAALWDLAVMLVIVEEAGGRFTDLDGARRADGGSGLATNGLVHEAALGIVGRDLRSP